jgi:hypothetical protein
MLIVSLTLLSVFVADAQKEEATAEPVVESDPSILTLPILVSGEPVELSFADTDGALLAAFNATEGDEVDISMTATSDGLDPYIIVLGWDATPLAQDDDSGDAALDSFIQSFEVPASDTYFILATTFGGRNTPDSTASEDQTFELMVEGNTQPEGLAEDEFTYERVMVQIGDSHDVDINEEAPGYFVEFTGEEGQEITIDAPSDDLDTLMLLFDFGGNRIAADDDSGDVPLASHIETVLPETGNYILLLTTYNYAAIAAGDEEPSEGIINFSIQ